jgi:hypothetical protein
LLSLGARLETPRRVSAGARGAPAAIDARTQ